jgi:hypothetical protein
MDQNRPVAPTAVPGAATRAALPGPPPLPLPEALRAVARCAARTVVLLARREVHLPRGNIGLRIRFGDGSTGRVYRETVVDHPPETERCVLVVTFRLRGVSGRGHRAFEVESLLNTPLFVGFPGFVSKLWLTADARGAYRGLYDWDDPDLADAYARALWWVLALVSHRSSIHHRVLRGTCRDDVLAEAARLGPGAPAAVVPAPAREDEWWRVTGTL